MNRKSVNYEIGFADSELISFKSIESDIIVTLKCWNDVILILKFVDCILFAIFDAGDISDIVEESDSDLFRIALHRAYDHDIQNHPYRLFQFYDLSGQPAVEIGCRDLNISRGSQGPP